MSDTTTSRQNHKNESDNHDESFYKIAIEARNFEIELVLKRANIFWLFTAGAFLAYYAAKSTATYSIVIANVGFFCTACWTLVNRGSKYWQSNFEQWLAEIEGKNEWLKAMMQKYPINNHKQKGFFSGAIINEADTSFWVKRYSPSKLLIACSDFLTVIWFLLLGYSNCILILSFFKDLGSSVIHQNCKLELLPYLVKVISCSILSLGTFIWVMVLVFRKAKGED